MDLISVIIPIYNQACVLRRSLVSLVNQSYRPIEIIIVNDGSTDNFSEVIKNILAEEIFKELKIKVINQPNQGAPAARNHGFSESTGSYVIFWDADTIAKPEMLAVMHQTLLSSANASWAYSQFCFGWKKMRGREFDVELLKKNNYIDVTSLIRSDAFLPFDENLKRFQDWDLWLTLIEQGKSGKFINKVLYKKITNPIGISSWFPSFFFKLPWQTNKVKKYEVAKAIVLQKHHLI
ncbi:MAG: Glycosyl transferase, group 2 family protein [Candidatus Magasanikbacteria bacterium GW2011_GWA2_37_8]|uniref:Glycosyl transferase, group 2 family protein n=1 Tax=Candidatus Magasanikbacteria bacterium GW2011_GWA2_37_8 TaxID=1619036 RepID=A0A0G0KKR5_9BACT|nr:MAG: Glycosyl transferase, group 2 family protein [Candidatus Magasanikbacteria bacterium GW2011_GWA2_37_8]